MSSSTITSDEKRLQALYRLSMELTALQSLDSVLHIALKHCLALTGSQFGFIGLVKESGEAMDVVAVQGFHADSTFYDKYRLIPLRPNIFASVVIENRSLRSVDATVDHRRVGQPGGHPPVRTFLGVPLRHRDKPIGMIGVANRSEAYEEDDEHLLMTYAAQIAIVISNSQLYDQLTAAKETLEQKVLERTQALEVAQFAVMQKAEKLQSLFTETITIQENERQRIARDMHDGINQLLIGAMLELKAARTRLSTDNITDTHVALAGVHSILRDVEAEIQRVIYDLRPPSLDELGFVPALRRHIQDFRQYTRIDCYLKIEGQVVRLLEKSEVSIYRMLQEALQNVYNHAQAQQVDVLIQFTDSELRLTIEDNGIGFDLNTADASHRHFGLTTMRERANSSNGSLSIQTLPGAGTRILLCVPIE